MVLEGSKVGVYMLAQPGAAAGTTMNYIFYKSHYDLTEDGE